ncbi:hypothetical protein N8813_00100 [bacterium]|nr:hypothetical protein [bacterium]
MKFGVQSWLIQSELCFLLEQLPADYRKTYSRNLLPTIIQTKGIEEASNLFDSAFARASTTEEQDSQHLKPLFESLKNRLLGTSGIDNKVEWAKKHVGQPYAEDSFADYAAAKMVRRDVNQVIEWVEYADQEYGLESPNAFKALAKNWISGHGTENLANWLNTNSRHLAWERIAEGLYSNASSMKRDEISTLYDQLNDAGLKARLAERLQELEN